MKRFLLSAICLLVALAPAANAEDPVATKPAAPVQKKHAKANRARRPVNQPVIESAPAPSAPSVSADANSKGPGVKNQNRAAARPADTHRLSYAAALQKCVRERHDRAWWHRRYTVIVLVGGGYYYWDSGYWYPAFGYDPVHDYYDYDGPIYTYGNLLPDQVIVNVQRALKQLGYYAGGTTGSLGPASRQALANYQEDAGLDVTGAIDAATVEALGLN